MTPALLGELLGRLGPTLTLFARQYTLAAEDAVQDAFVRLAGQRAAPDNPEAWLFRTVRNRALDLRKTEARRKRREADHRPAAWFVESSVDGLDASVAVVALQRLPETERDVIIARLWGGLTLAEIAAAFDCSTATAHRRYEAGLARLRQLLGEACPNP
ncbi:RNA polymerase sigma factor [Zavarzinella formosa]|uniref:RNA polymerase sigma factor n=1 Tax=Zavarzinella formosa TaxID=360055 RepID=UPI0002EB95A0|nr:sigma-70 family RNA polymerase sigma factor [Zavarzinella formosa]